MHDDDVPEGEMRWFHPDRDEIDAVLGDDLVDDDLADVAAIVHDLRSAYLREEPVPRHPALAAFTSPHPDQRERAVAASVSAVGTPSEAAGLPTREATERKHPMLKTVSALVATAAGKIVLGTAIAAASVGGLHAADVVDVPGLPDHAADQAVAATAGDDSGDDSSDVSQEPDDHGEPAEAASHGQETAETAHGKQAAAAEFTEAMKDWSACAGHGDDDEGTVDEGTGQTDPDTVEACGQRPHPRDFGLTDPPSSRAADHGRPESTPAPQANGAASADDPGEDGTNTPADDEDGDRDPTDRGTNAPPDDVPGGAPGESPDGS